MEERFDRPACLTLPLSRSRRTVSESAGYNVALAAQISHAIRRRTAGAIRELVVQVSEDKIVLRGFCTRFYIKQVAQHEARKLAPEIEQVENHIVVIY